MDVFAVLSDPTRRAILELLAEGELTAGAICKAFPRLYQPTVSHHLKVMREAGLLRRRSEAQRRIYDLRRDGFMEADKWIHGILDGPRRNKAKSHTRRRR